MEVRNCRKCGRIFNYISGMPICPICKEENEKKFHEVKEYIRENHKATIPQICEDCGVDRNQVYHWIREERLVFADDSPVGINCEKCGASIKTGRFCEKCKADMANHLQESIAKPKPLQEARKKQVSSKEKMRFLDH